jgi:two-component system, sensor histidine kinase and response regulator
VAARGARIAAGDADDRMDERKIAVALSISGRIVAAATPWARYVWATAGAISMGGGIWSMHFVGMLAFSLPCGITYEPVGTVLSSCRGRSD